MTKKNMNKINEEMLENVTGGAERIPGSIIVLVRMGSRTMGDCGNKKDQVRQDVRRFVSC